MTVVVPIYGHWESLNLCLNSLIKYAPAEHFDILLINDCGPEADSLETLVLGAIKNKPNFRYERNPENFGFVKTCNRAVFELDKSDNDILLLNSDTQITEGALLEMQRVLYSAEHHGVVCPRSNDATIASLPFYKAEPSTKNTREQTELAFSELSSKLPRFYISPVSVGFCFLTKRSLINNYGLFDEIYGRGYNEENDYCLRINELGFSSLIANHALVFHVGGASFGHETKSELDIINGAILNVRYPYYPHGVASFIEHGYTAIDRFADLVISREARKPKILIDLNHLSLVMNGSTRNALSFLKTLSKLPIYERDSITIAAQPEAISEFGLDNHGIRVVPYQELNELFDVGVSISPVTTLRQLYTLNRLCAKWVVTHLDIITLRAMYLDIQVPFKSIIVKKALQFADKVISISQASIDDTTAFFQDSSLFGDRGTVIPQGAEDLFFTSPQMHNSTLREPGYVLLLGNAFKHKQTRQALEILSAAKTRTVCLSGLDYKDEFDDIEFVESGTQSDDTILELIDGASVVLFPSIYEGFGLPLVETSARNKPIIAFDTETTREVISTLQLRNVTLINNFDDILESVKSARAEEIDYESVANRKLEDYNNEVWAEVRSITEQDISIERLTARDNAIKEIAAVGLPLENQAKYAISEMKNFKNLRSYKLAEGIASSAQPIRKLKRKLMP